MDELRYRKYLKKRGYISRTIHKIITYTKAHITWLESKNIDKPKYQDILNYIGYLKSEGKSKLLINDHLTYLSNYYKYSHKEDITYEVRLIGVEKKTYKLFNREELEKIYEVYKPKEIGKYRETDKLILGLIIYQGLGYQELVDIKIQDIDLKKGKIYIRSGQKRKNSRVLNLESHQILDLYDYSKKTKVEENLFPGNRRGRLKDQLKALYNRLSNQCLQIGLKIDRLYQLRQSRCSIWIKDEGLRKGQYLSGFKSIVSAEDYKSQDITDLQTSIKKYHPLNKK